MSDSSHVVMAPTHKCSFCGIKNNQFNGVLIAGDGVCICQKCVLGCVQIIFESKEKPGGGIETK